MKKSLSFKNAARSVLILCLLFSVEMMAGTNGALTGKVVDEDGSGIVGANVQVMGTTRGARVMDAKGLYDIVQIPVGEYQVKATFVGMSKVIKTIKISADEVATLNFVLKADASCVDTIMICCSGNSNLGAVVGRCAGVLVSGNSFSIRNSRPEDTQVRVDGVDISDQFDGGMGSGGQKEGFFKRILKKRKDVIDLSDEEYSKIVENDFKNSVKEPVSTFSIDVDRASYSNVRRQIGYGSLPHPEAVRIEEMINYFDYDYPEPRGREPFATHLEMGTCPWNKDNYLLNIGIQGKSVDSEQLAPNNLVFLIDVSGSMSSEK